MVMQSLEHALERMVEGVFSRAFRTNVRPIELGRRLLREMDEHRSVDVKGRRIVPNDFSFHLSQRDLDALGEINEALIVELAEAARLYARDEGYHFMGPVNVTLELDPALKPGRIDVVSTMKESGGGVGAGSLVLPSGERIQLADQTVSMGRLPENTVPMADPNVSRHHAEIRPEGTGWVVVDLGSTNGTKVNGVRINGQQLLADGDIVSLGNTHVRFEAS